MVARQRRCLPGNHARRQCMLAYPYKGRQHCRRGCAAMTPNELAVRWRKDAELLERYGDDQLALVAQTHADELEAALRSQADDALDLATASKESGYSVDR